MEENTKRMMKSSFQIEALEEFYEEHKYPSEAMKMQFGGEIGLSVKQVSVWFCHRRAKDKMMVKDEVFCGWKPNVSDVVNEQCSEVVQESCSSTKHEDFRQFNHREVDSKRFRLLNSARKMAAFEKTGQFYASRNYNVDNDVSLESSSSSQEMPYDMIEEPQYLKPLRSAPERAKYTARTLKPSGIRRNAMKLVYPSSKNLDQTSAISFLKRKLGKGYHEDGPLISTDFDPLPPDAFDLEATVALNANAYYVGDPVMKPRNMAAASKPPQVYDNKAYNFKCTMKEEIPEIAWAMKGSI